MSEEKDQKTQQVTVAQREAQIWGIDKMRAVIRLPANALVDPHPNTRKVKTGTTMSTYRQARLSDLGDSCVIIDGYGNSPHGNTLVDSVQTSYEKESE